MEQDSGYGVIIGYLRSKDFRSQADRDTRKSKPVYQKQGLACPICSVGLWQRQKIFCKTLFEKRICRKPTLDIDMAEFRHMRNLMIKAQDKAKEIKNLQDKVLPQLKQQLADTKGLFKGKERKALEVKIKETEAEIADRLDKIPDTLKADGYP